MMAEGRKMARTLKMMSRILLGIVVLSAVVLKASATCAGDFKIQNGETITYNITKFGIKVGEAEFVYHGEVQKLGRSVIWITCTSSGFQFYDQEEIYLDPETFHPMLIRRDLDIFGKKEKIDEIYSLKRGLVRIIKIADGEKTEQTLESGGIFDNIYGFIYRIRSQGGFNADNGLDLHLPTQDVRFEFVKSMKYKIGRDRYEAYYLHSRPGNYRLWFDSGPRKIPLRIIGAIGIADLSMEMKEYKETGNIDSKNNKSSIGGSK